MKNSLEANKYYCPTKSSLEGRETFRALAHRLKIILPKYGFLRNLRGDPKAVVI